MESKTKNRILGLSIFFSILVLLLIFFQAGKDAPGEPTILKAPPFPANTHQVTDENTSYSPDTAGVTSDQTVQEANALPDEKLPESLPGAFGALRPSVINDPQMSQEATKPIPDEQDEEFSPKLTMNQSNKEISKQDTKASPALTSEEEVTIEKPVPTKPKSFRPIKSRPRLAEKTTPLQPINIKNFAKIDEDGLFKLKNSAWVIQMGSFKSKNNAVKLVNQLREKGFKAFIQQVDTSIGNSTRVFVGPETKHADARAVAHKLENQMHLHGIVISYKPLAQS
ncbi:MAG: SPOR domain-containing protein [Gammaproteobacteria bacterium]|nr:SPOR domain-containing protein [Gammaproteobacteria bacterium]